MKALLVWGGWEGHEPEKCTRMVEAALRDRGVETDVRQGLAAYDDLGLLEAQDLIVQCVTMSKIERQQEQNLLAAVEGGVGFGGWHGGMCDAFREHTNYQFMCGGQWVAHPGGVIDYTVQIGPEPDPITEGMSEFAMRSEQYYVHVDPNVKVLMTTTFAAYGPRPVPVTWTKRWGKGRVFYTSLGHVAADLAVPPVMPMLVRGLLWAGRPWS
jgi:type 1 glutamine amidotransferase